MLIVRRTRWGSDTSKFYIPCSLFDIHFFLWLTKIPYYYVLPEKLFKITFQKKDDYAASICISWRHRCVTHLHGISLGNFYCLNKDLDGLI
jgi:hypothetical protein